MYMPMLGAVFSIALMQASGAVDQLGPRELVDRYTINANRFKSCRILCGSTQEFHLGAEPDKVDLGYRLSDIRRDEDRTSWRWKQWGGVVGTDDFVPQEEATYHSMLWDGKTFSNYRADGKGKKGIIVLDNNPNPRELRSLRYLNVAAPLVGYYPNAFERVDVILRGALHISQRNTAESVNGMKCLVIDAKTKYGAYTIWLSPNHGYSIAKAKIQADQAEKPLFLDRPMQGNHWSFTIEIQRFEEAEGVYIPTEALLEESRDLPKREDIRRPLMLKLPNC